MTWGLSLGWRMSRFKVGIAIATYNRVERLDECLQSIFASDYQETVVTVYDDGDDGRSAELLRRKYSRVTRLSGINELWWAEATNQAIQHCLAVGCDAVIILNDDCILHANTITQMVELHKQLNYSVIAPVVVDIRSTRQVWWAGARKGLRRPWQPFWGIFQKFPHKISVDKLPQSPFRTDEFTGRGTFVSRDVFESVGLMDSMAFPQYGSDNDFSLRVCSGGHSPMVAPNIRVALHTSDAGQLFNGQSVSRYQQVYRSLFKRKNGEAAVVWAKLLWRHAPRRFFVSSYLAILARVVVSNLKTKSGVS